MKLQQFTDLPRRATLVMMRGEPGSGKSTQAEQMKKRLEEKGLRVGIFSTDNIFYNADGEYEFVPYAIGAAHAFERQELILSMRAGEYDVYYLANTHLQRWEMLDALRDSMYEHITVFVWDLRKGPNYGNIHGVPEDKVKMMLENSDKPYPSHIENYYAKNQEFYDWIEHTYNHTATESIALEYAILYDRGLINENTQRIE
jgi:hypothetical protein